MEFMVGRIDKAEIETMMPKMMEGVNIMEIMPKMMMQMMGGGDGEMGGVGNMSAMIQGAGAGSDMPMMPKMMTTMMPECLNVMLSYVPTGNRTDFAARMVATLMEKSSEGMPEEETKKIMGKIQELVKK